MRFIVFDAAGLVLLLAAAWVTRAFAGASRSLVVVRCDEVGIDLAGVGHVRDIQAG